MDTRTWTMGHYPTPPAKAPSDEDLVALARLFNHHALADRLEALTTAHLCVCNVGAQTCVLHGRITKTQAEKIAFRIAWDERVVS